ncbi:MAG: PilN domain-containing protein [Patescibacteria group bacterium]
MPEEKPGVHDNQSGKEIVEFADRKETDFSSLIVWLSFVVAVLFLGFIWFSDASLKTTISEKQSEKKSADATLALVENQKVINDVTGLKNVISILSQVSTQQESKKKVLDNLYLHFTKDVHISTIALTSDGTASLDGATASYRTVADFMLALKSYDKVSDLQLKSVSMSTAEDAPPNEKVTFSVSFKLDTTKEVTTESSTSSSTTTSSNAETETSESTPASTSSSVTTDSSGTDSSSTYGYGDSVNTENITPEVAP